MRESKDGAIYWTVESMEEGVAVVEIGEGTVVRLPISALPSGAVEGDVIAISMRVAHDERERRLASSRAQISNRPSGGSGDVVL